MFWFEGYLREDGLWDIEGHLIDRKPMDCVLASGVRPAGTSIHDMWIRLTIDTSLNITDVAVASDELPYPGHCERIGPAYVKLIGHNLGRGFRGAVRDLFAGVHGCTHLTEMLGQFPTAAIQSFAGTRRDTDDAHGKPFQLDRCHALDTHGEAVRQYYPRWHKLPQSHKPGAKPGSGAG